MVIFGKFCTVFTLGIAVAFGTLRLGSVFSTLFITPSESLVHLYIVHFTLYKLQLNPQLRYYFRFGKTNVRHIGIFSGCYFDHVIVISVLFRMSGGSIGPLAAEYSRSMQFQDGSRGGAALLPVSQLMLLHSPEVQNLSKNHISSTYLNLRLRYNYFRFGKTSVRHIGILFPVATSTVSQ